MTSEQFLTLLQKHAESFSTAVATQEGDWIIKGFIDAKQRGLTTFSQHPDEIARLSALPAEDNQ